MEYPTAFFQELFVALPGINLHKADDFSIHVTETCDTENYRIECHVGNFITFWEGEDWPTVLAECIADQQPF